MFVTTAGVGLGGLIRSAGEAIGGMFHHDAGVITSGSANVKVNSRAAAHVERSTVVCKDHSAIQRMAEGSTNIFINSKAAVRKDDKTTCDATVDSGSDNVVFGGGRQQYLDINREISDDWRMASEVLFFVAGIAGGVFGAARQLGCFGAKCLGKLLAGELIGAGIGFGISKGIEAIGGFFGNPVDVISGQKLLPGDDDDTDFILPGVRPLYWQRIYRSENTVTGALGTGWTLFWERTLWRDGEQIIYRNNEGREIAFPVVKPGERWFSPTEQIWLARSEDDKWAVSSPFETCFVFESLPEQGEARLSSIRDLTGNSICFSYTPQGHLDQVRTSNGYVLHCHWQGERLSSVVCVEGGMPGTRVSYQYDDEQQLVSVINQRGLTTRRFSWENGRMSGLADVRGLESRYTWSVVGDQQRITAYTTSAGEHWCFDYDTQACRTRLTDVNSGLMAEWEYNEQHLITAYRDFDGSEYRFDYNDQNMPVRFLLPGGREIQVDYDALARPVRITDPLGQSTLTDYHRNSLRVTRRQLADGRLWLSEYDVLGRLLKEKLPSEAEFIFHYRDNEPLPERVTRPSGDVQLSWQRHGEVARWTDCSGKTTHYQYDADGNLICVTNALGQETRYFYHPGGVPGGVRYADGREERLYYNSQGLVDRFTDAAGQVQRWQYNVRGQVTAFTDRLHRRLQTAYDYLGRVTSLENANGGVFSFSWDAAGRLASEHHPDNLSRYYQYAAAGTLSVWGGDQFWINRGARKIDATP
nr:DUF6531 domain-containing protein [Trabulsiella odontotermitis]